MSPAFLEPAPSPGTPRIEVLRRAARALARALEADLAGAYLTDPAGEELRPVAGYHVPDDLVQAFLEFPIPIKGHRFVVEAWETLAPVSSDDVEGDERIDRLVAERFPFRTLVLVPLLAGGELVGALVAAWTDAARSLTPVEMARAQLIARHAVVTMHGAGDPARPEEDGMHPVTREALVSKLVEDWRHNVEAEGPPAEPEPESAPEPEPAAEGAAIIGRLTVLVVDDEEELRAMLREVFEGAGFQVLEAREGDEALLVADWHDGPIDLVVTDIMMPFVGGGEFGQRVTPLRKEARVLYISGYGRHHLPSQDLPFLAKPFTPEAILAKAREVLAAPEPTGGR